MRSPAPVRRLRSLGAVHLKLAAIEQELAEYIDEAPLQAVRTHSFELEVQQVGFYPKSPTREVAVAGS